MLSLSPLTTCSRQGKLTQPHINCSQHSGERGSTVELTLQIGCRLASAQNMSVGDLAPPLICLPYSRRHG